MLRQNTKEFLYYLIHFSCDDTWYVVNRRNIRHEGKLEIGESYDVQWGARESDTDFGKVVSASDSWVTCQREKMAKSTTVLKPVKRETPAGSSKPPRQPNQPKAASRPKLKSSAAIVNKKSATVIKRCKPASTVKPPVTSSIVHPPSISYVIFKAPSSHLFNHHVTSSVARKPLGHHGVSCRSFAYL